MNDNNGSSINYSGLKDIELKDIIVTKGEYLNENETPL